MYSELQIRTALCKKGYQLHTEYWYPNFIGVRDLTEDNIDQFNDTFIVLQSTPNSLVFKQISITTDPGKFALYNPINKKGTGFMAEGWHKGLWKFGYHKGQYKALVQNNPVPAIRYNYKDDKDKTFQVSDLHPEIVDIGVHGANFHKAGKDSQIVHNWSYMCQVCKREQDFFMIYDLAEKSGFGIFDYYLLNKNDL